VLIIVVLDLKTATSADEIDLENVLQVDPPAAISGN